MERHAWAVTTPGPEGTARVGEALGQRLEAGDVVTLQGPLGAGKTTFVRGMARGLGIAESAILSPTFLYVREVRGGRLALYHVDGYRLADGRVEAAEAEALMEELGLDWYLQAGGVVAVEWPERVLEMLPAERFAVQLEFGPAGQEGERILTLDGLGRRPARVVAELAREYGRAPAKRP